MRAVPKWVEKIHEENGENEPARFSYYYFHFLYCVKLLFYPSVFRFDLYIASIQFAIIPTAFN